MANVSYQSLRIRPNSGIDARAARNHSEQATRPAVVNCNVWDGEGTWLGAQAQGILMSVIRTCGQRAVQPMTFLSTIVCQSQPQFITA